MQLIAQSKASSGSANSGVGIREASLIICWMTNAPSFDERSVQNNINLAALLFFEEFGHFAVYYFVEVFFADAFGESA
jgi:hypothetical protein